MIISKANNFLRYLCTNKLINNDSQCKFETVFALPQIKYIALLNRLKVYHLVASSIGIPSCGLMEVYNIVPSNTVVMASYIGLTGVAVLSLVSVPFNKIIGFLYISEDNKSIKISSVDFLGKRKDKIISAEDWIPLLDAAPKAMDPFYLTPELVDGTKYKLLLKYGKVLNARKMAEVLE